MSMGEEMAEYDNPGLMQADRDNAYAWEKFTPEHEGGNLISLKALNGKYVSARRDGRMEAKQDNVDDWARFEVYKTDEEGLGLAPGEKYLVLKNLAN